MRISQAARSGTRGFAIADCNATAAIERAVDHRPWPLPPLPWVMFQSWRNLLFAHWPVRAAKIRALVPRQLAIDEYDGQAWVSLTPFVLCDLRPRFLPALPLLSTFPEMNLRTYVRAGDKSGIYFFSLDAASRLSVVNGRLWYGLPYRLADMEVAIHGTRVRYRSARAGGAAVFQGDYAPRGPSFTASPGSLEHFLTERYAVFAVRFGGALQRGDIHHKPWLLQDAEVAIARNTVPLAHGIQIAGKPAAVQFAARQDTLTWLPMPA